MKKPDLSQVDDEIAAHLAALTQENIDRGMSPAAARTAALRSFGNVGYIKEEIRAVWVPVWIEQIGQDVRHGCRVLLRNPGFALVAVMTLALGIGVNVALFSVLYGALLKPLPYVHADRLVLIQGQIRTATLDRPVPWVVRLGELGRWAQAQTIEQPALYTRGGMALFTPNGSEVVDNAIVSTDFFSTLAGPLAAGRSLGPQDDALPSVIISDRLARRLFGSPQAAVGQHLTLSRRDHTIVGVTAPEFQFPDAAVDAWISARFMRTYDSRDFGFQMIARSRPGATISQIGEEMERLAGPALLAGATIKANVQTLPQQVAEPVRLPLTVVLVAVLLVLAVACLDLNNLLLARHASRAREFAVRSAVGASPRRLLAQCVVESTVLTILGGLVGIGVAYGLLPLLGRFADDVLPPIERARVDTATLLFAVSIMVGAGIVTGTIPALAVWRRIARSDVSPTFSRPLNQIRQTLCAAQWAVSFVLLIATALLGRSLVALTRIDIGASTDRVATASLNFAMGQSPSETEVVERVGAIVRSVRGLPGIAAVAVGTSLPPHTSRLRLVVPDSGGTGQSAVQVAVSPAYFAALGIQLVQGRFFTDADDADHPRVIIVAAQTAKKFFGEANVIGRSLTLPTITWGTRRASANVTLVGVVTNVKYTGLTTPAEDTIYVPFAQQPWIAPFLVTRTVVDPGPSLSTIRRAIATVDPQVVISGEKTLESVLSEATDRPRFQATVLTSLNTLALTIAAVGLYGLTGYAVAQRTSEFGVRAALGATSGNLRWLVFREGIKIAAAGLVIGFIVARGAVRSLSSLLYGVTPADPVSFVVATGVLISVASAACYLASRAVSRIDPVSAIRCD